ncbi:malonic semialdehyde reductase [Sulfuritalea sp.]|uniref:malonic semialdehyde reductase n=1 Tax=Sulfuritalea sp. TaxID=2480090 RepID=UPI001AC381A8|nr:malonic semialdehyde reductase [Sulfuritalea sp.]MBN8476321.1 malonic semialdehyde reductase [Sulfuritalea sp.]
MKHKLDISALEQLFIDARTFNRFTDRPVSEDTLRELYELLKWGPTAVNSQPARYVFIRSQEGKKKLMPALIAGNVEKTKLAPVTVLLAIDRRFFDKLPDQFRAFNAKPIYEASSDLAQETGLRNGSMQGAYLMLAARALGLDCGPMSGFDRSVVDAAFFPDGEWASNFLVNLGYGDDAHNYPRGPRLPYEDVVRLE